MRRAALPTRRLWSIALAFVLAVALVPVLTAPAQAATYTLAITPTNSGSAAADTGCATQVPGGTAHCPGLDTDLTAADKILRTRDTATVRFEYASSGPDTNVILNGTLTGGATWGAKPAACLTWSVSGATFTCRAPDLASGSLNAISFTLSIPNSAGDGTAVAVTGTVRSATNTTPTNGTSTVSYVSSARPEWNLNKVPPFAAQNTLPGPQIFRDPSGQVGWLVFSPLLLQSNRAYGSSGLPVNGVSFTDDLSGFNAAQGQTRLVTWGGYGSGCGRGNATASGGTQYVNFTNQIGTGSGTATCTQSAPGAPISVTLSGINTDGASGYDSYGAFWIATFTPASAFTVGSTIVRDRLENFDPDDRQGVSNFGAGGSCTGATNQTGCEPLTDNTRSTTINNTQAQSTGKTLLSSPTNPQASYQPGSANFEVDPGSTLGATPSYRNSGSLVQNNVTICDKIDSTTQTLTAWPTGQYVIPVTQGTNNPANVTDPPAYAPAASYNGTNNFLSDPAAYSIEYGVGDYGTTAPGSATVLQNTACGDADSPIGWSSSPTSPEITAYAQARGLTALEAVTKVRVRLLQPLQPGQQVAVKVLTTVRTDFRAGPPNGGTPLFGTTPVRDAVATRADELNPAWSKPAPNGVVIRGLAPGTADVSVSKSADPSGTIVAGNQVTYSLAPRYTYAGPSSELALRVFDVLPPDLAYVEGSASLDPTLVVPQTGGSTLLVWDLGFAASNALTITYRASTSTATPNGTQLINSAVAEGRNAAGAEVDSQTPIFAQCSQNGNTRTIPATPSVATAKTVSYPANVNLDGCRGQGWFQRYDQRVLTLANSAILGVVKTPLRSRIQVGDDDTTGARVGWTLLYRNLSSDPLSAIDAIDVLPYNGDGRTPASQFTGALSLTGLTTTDTPSATPNALPVTPDGAGQPRTGTTFYYTSATPASIATDPNAASNLASGSTTWCLQSQLGTAGCPANLAAVTAFRVISGTLTAGGGSQTVTAAFDTNGNADGNLYTNAGAVRARGLTAPAIVPSSTIQVVGAAVGGTLWDDVNDNGVIDTGETRLANVAVQLLNSGGTQVGSTTTAADGTYSFPNLRAGTYTVRVAAGAVAAAYPALVPNWDSDSLFTNPDERITATLGEGVKDLTKNFGYSSSSLSGFVYADDNGDGQRTAADAGIAGVTITLTGTTRAGTAVSRTTTTLATGAWSFTDLQPGTYNVTETQPAGYLDGPEALGTTGGAINADNFAGITLGPGDKGTNYRFAEYTPTALSGRVFSDDGNGTFDATDTGIGNVAVRLTGIDVNGTAVDRTLRTNADGTYIFTGLVPGTYTLTETQPTGYADGIDRAGPAGGTVTNDRISAIPIPSAGTYPGYTFAELRPAITLAKTAQTLPADTAPGPYVPVGNDVAYSLLATNTGTAPLNNVTFDDAVPGAACDVVPALAPGATATCTFTVPAEAGQQQNLATVTGTTDAYNGPDGAAPGIEVSATDLAHYFGTAASLRINKRTQTLDPSAAPGPAILVGRPVRWTYQVSVPDVPGAVRITNITVTDDKVADPQIVCPSGSNTIAAVDPGQSVTCAATGVSVAGQYSNLGSANGSGPSTTAQDGTVSPLPVSATDRSWYYGSQSGVEITKTVNGQSATTGGGPLVATGSTVRFAYTVNNIGNTPLTDVTVTDDRIAAGDIDCGDGSNVVATLAQGAQVVCQATEDAQSGLTENTGTVRAVGPQAVDENGTLIDINVVDDQRAAYTGIAPSIDIVKTVQGQEADAPTGPVVPVGQDVVFVYTVTNTGDVPLTAVTVTDDKVAAGSIICESGSNLVGTLAPTAQARCVATVPAVAGQQTNIGTATGIAPGTVAGDGSSVPGATVTDADNGNYFGGAAAITLAKQTNGVDGATAPGPLVVVGDAVRWTYTVANTGNLALTDVTVVDNPAVSVDCGGGSPVIATLAVDAAPVTCVATGVAVVGQFENTATVTGQTPGTIGSDGTPAPGAAVNASDTSHYFGLDGGLSVEKRVQGQDADSAPGPYVPVGGTVSWTFVVTNIGNAELSDIAVADPGLTVACPATPLAVGGSVTCTASGTAEAGQQTNTATASGTTADRTGTDGSPTPGKRLTSIPDSAYYVGSAASVALVKRTQSRDVSAAPGPPVQVGEPVRWTYEVSVPTGPGAVRVSNITVTDDQVAGTEIACPDGRNTIAGLDPGQSVTCSATGVAVAGQYRNEGTAAGSAPPVTTADGTTTPVPVSATDASWYFGSESGVEITKTVNGQSATTGGGPLVPVGSTVRFAYTVRNTGNTPLTAVTVTDDRIASGDIDCGDGSNVVASLAESASVVCRASETAQSGLRENTGTVRGVGPSVTQPDGTVLPVDVTGSQRAAYTGIAPAIEVVKTVQGQAADTAPGPVVPVGEDVEFVYTVTNSGTSTLSQVRVTDDQLADAAIDCGSGSNVVATLPATESVTCTATAAATAGQYTNTGTAEGTAPDTVDGDGNTVPGVVVDDTDLGHYFGGAAGVGLVKQTNGVDGADAPGPLVVVGDPVRWTYTVTNTGNLPLTDVTVSDDPAVTINCGGGSAVIATLAVDAAPVTCVATGVATAGQFENTATVTGQTPGTVGPDGTPTAGVEVSATDTSHYFGLDGGLSVEKRVQGQDADTAPGPYVPVGDALSWTFVVTNIGNAELSDIAVADPGLTVDCPAAPLAVDGTVTCTASGTASAGQQTNTATVSGTTADRTGTDGSTTPGKRLTSIPDSAYYFGGTTGLTLTKQINASTASATAPGVLVPAGSTMRVTVVAENTGNAALTDVTVTDDQLAAGLDCGGGSNVIATLAAGSSVTCTGETPAPTGDYTNTVTGEGTAPGGTDGDGNPVPGATVTAEPDTAYAYGFAPSLAIEKTANGEDADTAPGPRVDAGSTVSYAVTLTNPDVPGAIAVANVNVTDVGVDLACELDGSPVVGTSVASLAVGATLSCTADVTAQPGQQVNNAQVSGLGPVPTGPDGTPGTRPAIAEADAAYYFGATAALTITTVTNGAGDAADDTAPGPRVRAGAPVRFTYFVTNPDVPGASTLTGVALTDPGPAGATISCAGGGATIATLAPGDTVTCVADGATAVAGQYASTVTAVGTPVAGLRARSRAALLAPVTVTDQVHYFGVTSSLSVVTEVNGVDKDDGTGVQVNSPTAKVTWTITNTGNSDLSDLAVDLTGLDVVGALECTPELSQVLPAGETVTCTVTVGIAPKTTERSLGRVTARGPVTSDVAGAAVVGEELSAADAIVITRTALPAQPGGGGGNGGDGNGNGSGSGSGSGSGDGLPDTGSPVTWWMLAAGPLLLLAGLMVLWRRRHMLQ